MRSSSDGHYCARRRHDESGGTARHRVRSGGLEGTTRTLAVCWAAIGALAGGVHRAAVRPAAARLVGQQRNAREVHQRGQQEHQVGAPVGE